MWQSIKRMLSPKLVLTILVAIAIGVGATWIIVNATGRATSEEPDPHVADLNRLPLTPLSIPTALKKPVPLDQWPECRVAKDEVPGPGLPPLPCHYEGSEPPLGTIPTASPTERAGILTGIQIPEGWQVYDNPMFRYTFALPSGWYANMRPEGGEFSVFNAVAMEWFATGEDKPGGLVMFFSAGLPSVRLSKTDAERLDNPNANFGGYDGATWEDPGGVGLGVARVIVFAFVKDGVVFRGRINFGEGYSEDDVATVRQILATITPY